MNAKFLAAAAFVVALVPTLANAASVNDPSAPKAVTEHDRGATNDGPAFLTRLIVPGAGGQDAHRPPVAYADNPNLIGHRDGSSDAMRW